MKYVLLIFMLSGQTFAEGGGGSPLDVSIRKKAPLGEIFVSAVDEGSSREALRLIVRAKCGDGKWKVLDQKHEKIAPRACFVQADGAWNAGLQTLKFTYWTRSASAGGEQGPCDLINEVDLDLREICGN